MTFNSSAGNQFNINVGVRIDKNTSEQQIRRQLSELERVSVVNIKTKFDGREAVKQITTYKDALGRLIETQKLFDSQMRQLRDRYGQFSNEGREVVTRVKDITNSVRNLTTETTNHITSTGKMVQTINTFKNGVLQGTTEIEKYKNAMGQLVVETTKFDAEGKQLGAVERQIANDTRTVTTEISKVVDAQGREITTVRKLNAERNGTIEITTKQRNAQGALVTTTEQMVVANGRNVQSTREVTTVTEQETNALQRAKQSTNDFIATMGKVIKFQIITKIITGFTNACRNAVNIVKEFDLQLTEMKKVSDYSGEALENYTKQLGELGTAVARTRTQMVESATQFIKAGYNEETAGQLAQISALFQNIADSELSAGQSATFIISQMKAFRTELEQLGDEGKQAVYVIDSINEVSNNMAVSSTDISTALSKTASAMSALGNNYNQTIALVTSGTEIMQGQASKVARGLRSFGNQIAKTATSAGELSFEVQGVTKSIALMGSDGNLKSTYDVLKEISLEWEHMTSAERQALGISLAGKTQFEVFTSVLNNFADAEKALTIAENAQGSAWRENARYMESIQAKFQALKTAIENLVLGNGGIEKLVKKILELATEFVKLIDNAGGLTTVIATLTGVLILLNNKAIVSLITNIPNLITGIFGYITAINTATTSTELFIAVANVATLGIGALVIGITALVAVLIAFDNATERAVEKIQELNQKIEAEGNEIQEINKQLEEATKRLKELNKIESPTLVEQKEINNLDYTIRQLQRELAIKKEIAKHDEEERRKQANKVVSGRYRNKEDAGDWANLDSALGLEGTAFTYGIQDSKYDIEGKQNYQVLKIYADRIQKINEETQALEKQQAQYAKGSEEYEKYQKQIEKNTEVEEEQRKLGEELYQQIEEGIEGLSRKTSEYLVGKEALDYYADGLLNVRTEEEKQRDALDQIEGVITSTTEQYSLSAEQQEELSDLIDEATAEIDDETEAYNIAIRVKDEYINSLQEEQEETINTVNVMEEINNAIDELQSVYSVLSSAVDEYNSAEGMTIDTLQSLLQLDPQYLSMLDIENGKLVLNKQALMEKATAQVNEAKAIVYSNAVKQLQELIDKKTADSTNGATASLDRQTEALKRNSAELTINSEKEIINYTAKARQAGVSLAEIQKVINDMRTQLKIIDSVTQNVGVNFDKTMSTGREATDRANKSIDRTNQKLSKTNEQLERLKQNVSDLKDDVSDYEKVIDYINDKLDGEIERLEDLRDKEIEVVEKQIENLEEVYKKEEELAKERIKQIEEERDALIDANKLEINALQERQNAEEEYWNSKIQALKDQNKELEDQADLERLLENLQKAKDTKIRVYKEGQGFVWDTDSEAVTKAQRELDAYNRKKNYEKQLAELEKFKKDALDNYEQQINDLKTLNDNIKNKYDEQINQINKSIENKKKIYEKERKILEQRIEEIRTQYQKEIDYFKNYKDEFNRQVNAYENEQLRLLALELTGIDFENENWKTRLSNLDKFVTEYNKKLEELEKKQKELEELERKSKETTTTETTTTSSTPSTPSSPTSTSTNTTSSNPKPEPETQRYKTVTVWTAGGKEFADRTSATAYIESIKSKNNDLDNKIAQTRNSSMPQSAKESQIKYYESQKQSVPSLGSYTKQVAYASGVASIGANQFAIVGENPNKEIVIGSKLNGLGLNLTKGTGVVNAKSTNTLAGLFNMLGGELSKGFNGSYNLSNTNTQSSNNIHIDNISLPQVRDAEDFVNALSNFQNIMTQKAYAII